MVKPLSNLQDKLSSKRRKRVAQKFEDLLKQYPMGFLRKSRGLSQAAMAKKIGITQAAISQKEGQADFLVSTFCRFVEALGGEVRLNIAFEDISYSLKCSSEKVGGWDIEEVGSWRYPSMKDEWVTADALITPQISVVPANDHCFHDNMVCMG